MAKPSRDKGARGEREAAAFLSQWFPGAKRSAAQSRGGFDAPDVEGVYGFWVEVKRYRAPQATRWMAKAEKDMAAYNERFPVLGAMPLVLIKGDRTKYLVAIDAEWFFNEYVKARPFLQRKEVDNEQV